MLLACNVHLYAPETKQQLGPPATTEHFCKESQEKPNGRCEEKRAVSSNNNKDVQKELKTLANSRALLIASLRKSTPEIPRVTKKKIWLALMESHDVLQNLTARVSTLLEAFNKTKNARGELLQTEKHLPCKVKPSPRCTTFVQESFQFPEGEDGEQARWKHRSRRGARRRCLPQVLIIGFPKCGTRAMLNFLRTSPHFPRLDIQLKEKHFWDNPYRFQKGEDWYLKHMPLILENQISIEKTPSYVLKPGVAQKVFAMNPHMLIIVLVCNPMHRALGWVMEMSREKTLERFHHNLEHYALLLPHVTLNSRRTFEDGQYIRFLLDWYETFPSEQILVVESSKLITPMALMHEVSAFLQLDLKVSSENFVFDAERNLYCPRDLGMSDRLSNAYGYNVSQPNGKEALQSLFSLSASKTDKLVDLTKIVSSNFTLCPPKTKGRKHPPISFRTRKILLTYYQPFNDLLFKLLGQTFPSWQQL